MQFNLAYLYIQNRKLKQQFRTEFLTINRDLKALSQMLLENNYNMPAVMKDFEPHVSNELRNELMGGSNNIETNQINNDINNLNLNDQQINKENNLKDEYNSFILETNENYEDISEELKNEIEELELRESSNEESVSRGEILSELEPSFLENKDDEDEDVEYDEACEDGEAEELQEVFQSESVGNNVSNLVNDVLAQTISSSPISMEEININKNNKLSKSEIEKMTVNELQDIARSHKLKVKGKKNELMERINEFYNN